MEPGRRRNGEEDGTGRGRLRKRVPESPDRRGAQPPWALSTRLPGAPRHPQGPLQTRCPQPAPAPRGARLSGRREPRVGGFGSRTQSVPSPAGSQGAVRALKSPQTRAATRARARPGRDLRSVPPALPPAPELGRSLRRRRGEASPAPVGGPSGRAGPGRRAPRAGARRRAPRPRGHNFGRAGGDLLRPVSQLSPHSASPPGSCPAPARSGPQRVPSPN